MKKYMIGILSALLLTGCGMNNNRSNTNNNSYPYDDYSDYDDRNDFTDDVRDGINDIGEDFREGVNDIGEDIQEGYDDLRDDDYNNNGNDSTAYVIPNFNLWDFPSYCNARVGYYYLENI